MLTLRDKEAIPYVKEETTVIGDIDEFMEYVESGKAQKEWDEKIFAIQRGFNEYVKEHPHVWDHIVLFYAQLPAKTKTKRNH